MAVCLYWEQTTSTTHVSLPDRQEYKTFKDKEAEAPVGREKCIGLIYDPMLGWKHKFRDIYINYIADNQTSVQ